MISTVEVNNDLDNFIYSSPFPAIASFMQVIRFSSPSQRPIVTCCQFVYLLV